MIEPRQEFLEGRLRARAGSTSSNDRHLQVVSVARPPDAHTTKWTYRSRYGQPEQKQLAVLRPVSRFEVAAQSWGALSGSRGSQGNKLFAYQATHRAITLRIDPNHSGRVSGINRVRVNVVRSPFEHHVLANSWTIQRFRNLGEKTRSPLRWRGVTDYPDLWLFHQDKTWNGADNFARHRRPRGGLFAS